MIRSLFKKAAIFTLTTCIVLNSMSMPVFAAQSSVADTSKETNSEILEQVTTESSGLEDSENSSENEGSTSGGDAQETTSQDFSAKATTTEDTTTEDTTTEDTITEDTITEDTTSQETTIQDTLVQDNVVDSQEEVVECTTGYIEDEFIIPSISETYDSTTSTNATTSASSNTANSNSSYTYAANIASEIPTSYSFKDNLPDVREQGGFGVCWSFAAVGAAEASIISKGLADKTLDLSELQLAYFFYHTVADPLGNTIGDETEVAKSNYLDVGGNSVFTTFALASWTGMTDETKAPYHTASVTGTLDNSLAYDDAYHMQNAYWINIATDSMEVKKLIMEYGAVASSYYTDQSTTTASTPCYNPVTYAYYYDGSYTTNHAITIVGWDDNYSLSNFNSGKQPSSNGAWLVRNSWGSTLGDNGYFWISYEDTAFNNTSFSKAFVFDFESGDNYDHNYQYDGASGANGYSVSSGGSIGNIFTASGNSIGVKEQIDAVSFALYDVNVDYSIQIYTDLTDTTNPTSGTAKLTTPKTGSTSYVGYYTVPLEQSIEIDKGEKFSVVVTLSKSNGATTYFFGDKSYQNSDWIKFTNTTNAGQSFRKYSDSSNWTDMNSGGVTARVKAFTRDVSTSIIEATGIALSSNDINLKTGQSTTLTASVIPENTTDKSVTWSSGDGNVATVDSNGLVTAIAAGTTTVTAKTKNNTTTSCLVSVTKEIQQPVQIALKEIKLNTSSISMRSGDKITIQAAVSPSNATDSILNWSTSNSDVATVDSNGEVTATGIGNATITAASNNGITKSITITVAIGKTTSLVAKSKKTTSIKLRWNKQKGVSGYAIYRYSDAKKKYIRIATNKSATKTTYINYNRKIGTTYKYKVRAYVKTNGKITYGSYSDVLITATRTKVPTLSSSSKSKKVKLTWDKVRGASGYEIIMSTSKSKGYKKIKTITKGKTVSYTKRKLVKGKTYYFKIRTYKTVNGVKIYSLYSKYKAVKAK